MNCVIVDDDEVSSQTLRKYIEKSDDLNILKMFKSPDVALEFLNQCEDANILFLDIEMPGMDGLELIKKLKKTPHIVVISSKPDYAAEAYNFDVVDYIVKPVSFERLVKAINKVNRINENLRFTADKNYFYVKCDGSLIRLNYNDIIYIEALADYVIIHTQNKRYTVLSTMKGIETQLPLSEFMRVHRSFLVRLDKITSVEDYDIHLDGHIVPLSKPNKEEFMKKIKLISG